MGYQESLIKTTNNTQTDQLVKLIKKAGKEYFEDIHTKPYGIVTFKKDITCNCYGCDQKKCKIKAGDRLLWIGGERDM